jgi:hypothetical protein
MSTPAERAAKKLAAALDRARNVQGLSDSALNAAAAASTALVQNAGLAYPADYVRKRVAVTLAELEEAEQRAAVLDDAPPGLLTRLLDALRPGRSKRPDVFKKRVETLLKTYCAARGSGTEWKRPPAVPKAS